MPIKNTIVPGLRNFTAILMTQLVNFTETLLIAGMSANFLLEYIDFSCALCCNIKIPDDLNSNFKEQMN